MNLAEKILVVIDQEVSYNLCVGGKGDWSYVNSLTITRQYSSSSIERMRASVLKTISMTSKEEFSRRNKKSVQTKKLRNTLIMPNWLGRKHSDETKKKMSASATGKKSSQYGTIWITNGILNKKIVSEYLDEYTKQGYYKGRTL